MTEVQFLGPYKSLNKLGQGGMGAVYAGEHTKSGEKVAIKVIASQIADKPRFRRRFANEIETLKKLKHPNIVCLVGYGEEQGHLFYSMELIEGPSLQQHIRAVKRMPWREAVQFGIDICAALKHAHDFGVIHRDLKPANLLITPQHVLKLTDFGIVKLWSGDEMTAAGAMLGTADYMAPEQAGDGSITQRTDLYALGNVLYACLAGRPPFAGKDLTQVITALHRDPPPPLDLILPDLPEDLVALIHQMLEKSPQDRPPTALAISNRLKAILTDPKYRLSPPDEKGKPTVEATVVGTSADGTNSFDIDLGEANGPQGRTSGTLPTDQRRTLSATSIPAAAASPTGKPFNLDETIDSVVQEFRETPTVAPQTHFRTVDQEERNRAFASSTPDDDASRSRENVISIALLIVVLIAMIGGAAWLMRAPTADSLYNTIAQAQDFGEAEQAAGAVKQFLALYPEDPRADEVSALADQIDSDRVFRRLRVRARFKGGIEQLDPAEQSFVEAMMLREENPTQARQMMENWLIVYGHADREHRTAQRLLPIVRQEVQPLKQINNRQANEQAVQLKQWVDESLRRIDEQQHRQFLQSVIDLYEGKAWAAEVIQEVNAMLTET
ncbi:MAG: serine/threonine-protein kinase [Pirellulaceae bacterium]